MNPRAMGLLSFFRSNPDATPSDREKMSARGLTWRKTDFVAFSAGEELQVVYGRKGTPITVPAFALEFAMTCHEFLPLEQHLAKYADKHDLHPLQMEALRQWLPRLAEAGALASSEQVRTLCATPPASISAPPPISFIGFPTGGPRIETLKRSIESFAMNLMRHERSAGVVIADSSLQASHRQAFRELAMWARYEFSVKAEYSGEEERLQFIDELVKRKACRRESAEFALLDPLRTGFACGANRNALLLHGVGQTLCSVDDDVICRLARPPETSPAPLGLFSNCDPFARWLYPDRESTLAAARFGEYDFLAAHEELLGRSVSSLFPPELRAAELHLPDVGDDLLRRLTLGPAQIRTTYLGHVGDPGIPSSCYYLYYDRENRRRLTQNEAHYRAALGSRSVIATLPTRSIGDSSVCPGMAMGLDHRELLPPFFPVLHAEDYSFGAAVWQCCRNSVAGHQPLAIYHEPGPGKTILQPKDLGPDHRVVVFEFAHLLRRVILDHQPAQRATTAERTRTLGRHLSELATMPLVDFVEVLREKILEHESEKLGYLEDRLVVEEDAPDYWRHDVEAFLQHSREALAEDDFDIPYDLKSRGTPEQNRVFMQTCFARYGALLEDWPDIVEATRELNNNWQGLTQPSGSW